MKLVALFTVPAGVVTLILPVVAAAGTVAVMLFGELTVKGADTPLNFTAVAPVKPTPESVTLVPAGPLLGMKLVIDNVTVKLVALRAVPAPVETVTRPVLAPLGTVAVIWVDDKTVKLAFLPLNLTVVAPVRLRPVMVTLAPVRPVVGARLDMVGLEPGRELFEGPVVHPDLAAAAAQGR